MSEFWKVAWSNSRRHVDRYWKGVCDIKCLPKQTEEKKDRMTLGSLGSLSAIATSHPQALSVTHTHTHTHIPSLSQMSSLSLSQTFSLLFSFSISPQVRESYMWYRAFHKCWNKAVTSQLLPADFILFLCPIDWGVSVEYSYCFSAEG